MKKLLVILFAVALLVACSQPKKSTTKKISADATQAEKLGFEKGKKVLLLHADDAGMCTEANEAIEKYLLSGDIKSTSAMAPCPVFEEFISWAKENPKVDVGVHVTLTSEWNTYRWSSVSDLNKVPGLIDSDEMFWHEVPGVAQHASAKEVETEIRAQIEKFISLGWKPTHMDSHMGTVFARPDYLKVYLKISEEYGIPAAVVNFSTEEVINIYKKEGYPITEEVVKIVSDYNMPKLDFYTSVPREATYEELRNNFFKMVKSLNPGLVQVFFHPSILTENLKTITNSWQQRVWEAELFSDPVVKKFFEDEGIVITNWKEIMDRFKQQNG